MSTLVTLVTLCITGKLECKANVVHGALYLCINGFICLSKVNVTLSGNDSHSKRCFGCTGKCETKPKGTSL